MDKKTATLLYKNCLYDVFHNNGIFLDRLKRKDEITAQAIKYCKKDFNIDIMDYCTDEEVEAMIWSI